jgi:hypothetical protein
MSARIKNVSLGSISLPYPFKGVLAPGEGIVVDMTAAEALAELGTLQPDSTLRVSDVPTPNVFDAFRVGAVLSGAARQTGVPMQNRIRMLGAPGAIVEGNTITIGADVYEFRGSTPPAGGTAGRIWVYNGANSAASRANFINAVNGVVDAATITYDGPVTEYMLAAAGITTGDVIAQSADAVGGNPLASTTATATTETLATVTDIWDLATMRSGEALGEIQSAVATITVLAEDIVKGNVQIYFPFTPTHCWLLARNRVQNEAYVISGNGVSLTLAGGASPNIQANDVVDILAVA